MKKALSILAGGIAATGIALAMAAPAQATEDQYLYDLAQNGFDGPIGGYIGVGYAVCDLEAQGYSNAQIDSAIVSTTGAGIYADEAAFIRESAELFLC